MKKMERDRVIRELAESYEADRNRETLFGRGPISASSYSSGVLIGYLMAVGYTNEEDYDGMTILDAKGHKVCHITYEHKGGSL